MLFQKKRRIFADKSFNVTDMSRLYPIGIQSFEKLREKNFLYVDKTDMVYQLAQNGTYYFLSRPRRFGKSLLISTLEAYFSGQKELFEGLAIEQLEQEWTQYPIFHLDLNAQRYETPQDLTDILNVAVTKWENEYGEDASEVSLSLRFQGVIQRAAEKTGHNVVILVDEYDKPLLQTIGNEALQNDYRNTLKAFYGVLKSCDRYIRFALLTGVTKFSKVSIFSDLNNLTDISMDEQYASICGITEKELQEHLAEDIHLLALENKMTDEATFQKLKQWYDGYHFTPDCEDIYNPFSLLNTFFKRRFGSYWFETGTPTFLVELLKHCRYDLRSLADEQTTTDVLGSADTMKDNPIPILYQSGYLTIKGYEERFDLYHLGFPNEEVSKGFMSFLLPYYAPIRKSESIFQISLFVQEAESGDMEAFMQRLQSFFADTPYELARDLERHYQNVLFIVFKLMGFYTQVEYHTSQGRIDLVLKTDQYIYVMEFKLEGTAEEALRQIKEKNYALPFASDPRKLFKVGVNFSNKLRNIEQWIIE